MRQTPTNNTLFYGDNLTILREHVGDESVDLIYLDPPFNSNANYNVLFRAPGGEQSQSQIEAFEDTWHWNVTAERAYAEVLQSGNSDAANMLSAMRSFLGTNDMMAYLSMMAVRLLELHRVLKPTGSLYLHCDPTASHYLKLLLDAVFGPKFYKNEIIWKRTSSHGDASTGYGDVTDTILFYSKTEKPTWNRQFIELSQKHTDSKYTSIDQSGRRYTTRDLRSPSPRPNLTYEYKGFQPHPNGWSISRELMAEYDAKGLLHFPKSAEGRIRMKIFLDERRGKPLQNLWDDISPINSQAQERLGYPTQKPVALLERILAASSNEGDVVLDPFCGCGTTVHAAQKMNRRWIGIDVTHLAVGLIQRRLRDAFPLAQFQVLGTPRDLDAAKALAQADKHQFQLWALSMIDNAVPYKGGRKGADGGVDGYVYFQVPSDDGAGSKTVTGKAIVSVKGGGVSDPQVKDLITTIDHEGAQMGLFVTLLPPTKPMVARAAAAGFYEAGGRTYPKVQILTIEQLFDGKRPEMPWLDPSVFKKAKREAAPNTQGTLL
ncbi:DNA methyltransferase [Brevundimonas sp.]|jgi:site-specific DNA-methyltransferase (adenine-specific)|uniref:DNA methyltransferase n=1 Tax=Brevundimonas sp. TaxID=1871086 RepID=UPI001A35D631|nr:DNA methyltransferase [Brevundimonas sp.]MBJ7486714.1 modification methylase EcaI [Brevundimonas sp.]